MNTAANASGGPPVSSQAASSPLVSSPNLREATKVWAKIGVLSFGGPAAQIALMHKMVVDEKRWLTEKQYLNALGFCMLLPGPEAMQLATYAGWRLHGVIGGLLAGLLFVLPGAALIMGLATLYAYFGELALVQSLFLGIKAVVVIVVIEALLKVAKRALHKTGHWIIAGLAFVAIFALALPFPLLIMIAAIYGYFFLSVDKPGSVNPSAKPASLAGLGRTVAIGLMVWWLPVLALSGFGAPQIMNDIALFFSKLAVVTFGGAYAVLAYMAQQVVENFGWMSAGAMMDALGLAETTPGPLILVTQFVGFISAFKEGAFWYGVAGASITLWVTFIPCFLWIFAGAPYIEWLGDQPRLSGAMSAITATVVGVILNLSIWFALHVFFSDVQHLKTGIYSLWLPVPDTINWSAVGLALAAGVLLLRLHWNLILVLGLAAMGGLLLDLSF